MREIKNQTFQAERSLFGIKDTLVKDCVFAGPEDGESPIKRCENIDIESCRFSLRYPIWHVDHFEVNQSSFDEFARAALWYCFNGKITHSVLNGIKALRDCQNIHLSHCKVNSPEFGWKSRGVTVRSSEIEAEYLFLDCCDLHLNDVKQKGKYSFQYCRDITIENSVLDTKDAFWHSENVTVKNSHVKGEYLAWFSENLTLENCVIEGTQPLCFCKGLKLINCKMVNCDLAFESSEVDADVASDIVSVKNPISGTIQAHSIGEVILTEPSTTKITSHR